MLTRFDEGEVFVYHVEGIHNIFADSPSGKMKEIWLSEKDY